MILRFLPKPLPTLLAPAAVMSCWLLGSFLLCPIACYAVIILCGTNFEGAAYAVLVAAPLPYGFLGWLMPERGRPGSHLTTALLLLGWTVVPAALCYFVATDKSAYATIIDFLFTANREMAPILFSSLFYTPQSSFGLEVLRPLAAASTQILMTGAFGIGMFINRRRGSDHET